MLVEIALFSLFLQKCLKMWGVVEWFEVRTGWCNWCFRFWVIFALYAIFWRVEAITPFISFVGCGASALLAFLIEKLIIYVDSQ